MYGDYDLSISLRDFESWSNWHFIPVSVHGICRGKTDGKCCANLISRTVVVVCVCKTAQKKKGENKQEVFFLLLFPANCFLAGPNFFFQQAKMFLVQKTRNYITECITYCIS